MSRVGLMGLLLSAAACASAAPVPPQRAAAIPPPQLRAPSALRFDFQWRQRVTAHWPTGVQSFEAVLQKRGGELMLVGLSPLGLPGFVFRLNEARELSVENRTGQGLPFEPAYVVADVQRVFFPWLGAVAPGFSGDRAGELAGTQVSEHYRAGQLEERTFTRSTPAGSERVEIRFMNAEHPRQASQDAPDRAELRNQLLSYELVIETVEQTRL
ncbi:MAG TPA: DUF3261 domain-containing protein [Polyangiales bacterium]|nr:DUF3261 domain-containing protein [Polyangiales bacterium]